MNLLNTKWGTSDSNTPDPKVTDLQSVPIPTTDYFPLICWISLLPPIQLCTVPHQTMPTCPFSVNAQRTYATDP